MYINCVHLSNSFACLSLQHNVPFIAICSVNCQCKLSNIQAVFNQADFLSVAIATTHAFIVLKTMQSVKTIPFAHAANTCQFPKEYTQRRKYKIIQNSERNFIVTDQFAFIYKFNMYIQYFVLQPLFLITSVKRLCILLIVLSIISLS